MLKEVDGYLLTCSLNKKIVGKVRPFSSAKKKDIHYYLKSTKGDFCLDIFILYVCTNNLSTPEMIADKVAATAKPLKTEDNNVVLSAIVPRGDKLNGQAEEVNNLLEKSCNQKQMDLIKHSNINKRHLNRNKLHLSSCEKSIFIRNI